VYEHKNKKKTNTFIVKIILFFMPFVLFVVILYTLVMFFTMVLSANSASSISGNSGSIYTYDETASIFGLPVLQEMRLHKGIDFDIEEGTPILAAENGVVEVASFDSSGYGNYVVINHGNVKTLYGHMREFIVHSGESVTRGQTIGYCGSTGLSTGPHLHFEIQDNGTAVDPMQSYLILKPSIQDGLTPELKYAEIDTERLKEYLNSKNSLLAQDVYINAILQASSIYNVNPLLLFAITGQEQSFVRKTDYNAEKIANNPFNVGHSWEEYNTTIEDTANIAANTVVVLSQGCPPDIDPIEWINKSYAEDENWHIGVRFFFDQLSKYCMKEGN
jgi:hypothetical protein